MAYIVLALFGAVVVNLSWIQLVRAQHLASHPANTRLLLKEYALERGAIRSADGTVLAMSEPTPDRELKSLRTYPEDDLFAHLTGYYSLRFGRAALERSYNEQLSGKGGVITMQDLGDRLLGRGKKGDTLVLYTDSRVQQAAQEALGDRNGAVIALDPVSGGVLAMYSSPSFDPNRLSQHSSEGQEQAWEELNDAENRPLINRAANALLPPGSTFKLVAAAAALENGISADTSFPATNQYQPEQTDRTIGNFGGATCGGTMAQAMTVSCNTYFARLGAELPEGALEETAEAFGFGDEPPLDIRATTSQLPTDDELESPAFRALSAIGQFDVRSTPLQMALVAAGIANGGNVPVPKIVKQVEDARGAVVDETASEVWRTAISPSTASTLKEMMVTVAESGTATRAGIQGVRVAAKTGTAQTGAEGDETLAWTVAFAPADTPRIAVAVVVEGQGSGSAETGGRLAAPIVREVLQAHRAAAGW